MPELWESGLWVLLFLVLSYAGVVLIYIVCSCKICCERIAQRRIERIERGHVSAREAEIQLIERRIEALRKISDYLTKESKTPSIPDAEKPILNTEDGNSDMEKYTRHPLALSAPDPSASSNRTNAYQVKERVDKVEALSSSSGPGKAILTIENERSDNLQNKLYPSIEQKNVTFNSNVLQSPKNASKDEGVRIQKRPKLPVEVTSIPDAEKAILTVENEASASKVLQNPEKVSKEEQNRISKTTVFSAFKAPSIPDPKKTIPTVENEESDTDYSQEEGSYRKSQSTKSLPWSTKAKHLYPKCNSAAQACRSVCMMSLFSYF